MLSKRKHAAVVRELTRRPISVAAKSAGVTLSQARTVARSAEGRAARAAFAQDQARRAGGELAAAVRAHERSVLRLRTARTALSRAWAAMPLSVLNTQLRALEQLVDHDRALAARVRRLSSNGAE